MARQRKQPATAEAGTSTCPECGKTFERPASLGAHRRRAHGVAGASSAKTPATRGARRTRPGSRNGRTSDRARSTSASAQSLDRDALLQRVFPNGMPARESVLKRANAWLDEAEKLASIK